MSESRSEAAERFRALCESVCGQRGWELQPNGIRVKLGGGRSQVIAIELFEHRGSDMVRFATPIGAVSRLSPVKLGAVLRLNCELPFGAFGIRDEDLVMIDTFVLADLDADELDASVRLIAEVADAYEARVFGVDRY